jgi:hypothetical protein
MFRKRQVEDGHPGHTYGVNETRRRRPASSWPASLLPTMLLVGLLSGGVASTASSSDDEPIMEMTVTAGR